MATVKLHSIIPKSLIMILLSAGTETAKPDAHSVVQRLASTLHACDCDAHSVLSALQAACMAKHAVS